MTYLPFMSIETHEREARDAMMRDGFAPKPDPEVAAALAAAGISTKDFGDRVRLTLPQGWTAEADPLDDRRWFLIDARGFWRFGCFWKDCGYEPARGSVAVVPEKLARIRRRWEGRDSQHFAMTSNLRVTLVCRCGQHHLRLEVSEDVAGEHSGRAQDFVDTHERRFLAELERNGCSGEPTPQARYSMPSVPAVFDPSVPLDIAVTVVR